MRARLLITGAALSIGLAATGCGAEDTAREALDPVAQAAEVTGGQDGGVAVTIDATTSFDGKPVSIRGSGVQDRKGRTGRFTFTAKGAGQSAGMEELAKDRVLYLGGTLFAEDLPKGKRWIKVDLNREAAKLGIDLDAVGGGATQDPAAVLDYLKGAGASRKVGTETIHGVKTTHYHVDVDLRRVASGAKDADTRSGIEKLIARTGTAELPTDVWVDDRHLVRRQHLAYDMDVDGTKAKIEMTIDLRRFGVAVDVTPPPADAVVDVAKVPALAG